MLISRRSLTNGTQGTYNLAFTSAYSAPLQGANLIGTMNTTHAYNEQFSQLFSNLNERRQQLQSQVSNLPLGDSSLRNQGVSLAWRYEKAEITMGSKGSANWNTAQRQEVLDSGRVRGAEGHHINSVGEHPLEQANPDNIKFVKSRAEHLEQHKGSWQNPTQGDMIDRNTRLEEVNKIRVRKNELVGIGLAAAIGLGVGLTIGVVTTLAKRGVSSDALLEGLQVGIKTGGEAAVLAVINHTVVRSIQEVATSTIVQTATDRFNFLITENLIKICNMAVIGTVSAVVFSTAVYVKLKWQGQRTAVALRQAGKTLATSLGILFLSIVAQGIWGGYAGLIASLSIGIMLVLFQFVKMKLNAYMDEKLRHFTLSKLQPSF